MKYVSIILLCSSLIFAGLERVSEKRMKIRLFGELSAFFAAVAEEVRVYKRGFADALAYAERRLSENSFSFPLNAAEVLGESCGAYDGWKNAVASDPRLKILGQDTVEKVVSVYGLLYETSSDGVAASCEALSRGFAEKKEELSHKQPSDERLTVTGAFLAAAAIFIILI